MLSLYTLIFRHAAISTHCQRAITLLVEKILLLNRSEFANSILSLHDLQIDNFEWHRCMLHMDSLQNQVYSIDLSDILAFEDVVSTLFSLYNKTTMSYDY